MRHFEDSGQNGRTEHKEQVHEGAKTFKKGVIAAQLS